MFKAVVCLCLLSGSWAGLTIQPAFGNKALVKQSHWFSSGPSPSSRVAVETDDTILEWGVDAWESMTNGAQYSEEATFNYCIRW